MDNNKSADIFRKPSTFIAPALLILSLVYGCGSDIWSDREPAVVDDIRVDSLKFLPYGSLFVLKDSATKVAVRGYHPGYACSEILVMEIVESGSMGNPTDLNIFRPRTRIRLPEASDCPLITSADTAVTLVLGLESGWVRLANSSGKLTDSARIVRGTIAYDTLRGKLGIAGTLSKGTWTLRDSSKVAGRLLYADSLPPCRYLNQAEYGRQGDSITLSFSYVTFDPAYAVAPDTCQGAVHGDSLAPVPRLAPILDPEK